MSALARWWQQADQYEWLSSYLNSRGFSRPTRIFMAIVSSSGVLVTANALWGPSTSDQDLFIVLGIVAGAAGFWYLALWLTRWPSRRQSIGFAVVICASIALGSWMTVNSAVGLMSCAALAVSGGYAAFFHSSRLVTANMIIALSVAAIHAVRLTAEGEAVLAWSTYFLVIELNAGVPLAIQIVVHALGFDLIQSDRDPLTGMLNRRSFQRKVVAKVLENQCDGGYLAFAMIDPDLFKRLNDTLGHSAGDDALVAVGNALCERLPASSILGRVGGEEFLVADIIATTVARTLGEQARAAVSTTQYDLTASVGTATVAITAIDVGNIVEALHWLTVQADVAMYRAKHAGRNRVRHHGTDDESPSETLYRQGGRDGEEPRKNL